MRTAIYSVINQKMPGHLGMAGHLLTSWQRSAISGNNIGNDMAQGGHVQVLLVQKSHGARLHALAMELTVWVGADQDDAALGTNGLDAPRTGNTILVPQDHIDHGKPQINILSQVNGALAMLGLVNRHPGGEFADHTL